MFFLPNFRDPCSSLGLWKGIIVGAFGNGQIKVFDCTTGRIGACANAHARWINAIDIAKNSGLVNFFFFFFGTSHMTLLWSKGIIPSKSLYNHKPITTLYRILML